LNILASKFKENSYAIIPIIFIVFLLQITIISITMILWLKFLIGALLVILGLTLFLVGVDLGITPFGSLTGNRLTKTRSFWIIISAALILGFFISIAEPGLIVLANQVEFITLGAITSLRIVLVVSLGLAIMFAFGFFRIIYSIPLYIVLIILYGLIFILSLFVDSSFLAIAFDTSGATTGIMAVPFILALSAGISVMKKDSKASEKDSFGLVAIASTGPILAIIILSFTTNITLISSDIVVDEVIPLGFFESYFFHFKNIAIDSIFSILPLLIIFIILNIIFFKLERRNLRHIMNGFIYTFIGLILFLIGVYSGFMELGAFIGESLYSFNENLELFTFAFLFGFFTIVAEPAVNVLSHQIEDITTGYVKRHLVLLSLAIGAGLSIVFASMKIVFPNIYLWHFLLIGYVFAILLMFFTPKLFIGIAFDAGGVATGPLTTTFILAFIYGIAGAFDSNNLVVDGFGMIALVALMPIITLQILGIIYKIKYRKGGL
jgi:hypothetical protein